MRVPFFIGRIKKGPEFRAKVLLQLSLLFNGAYSVFLFIVSLIYSSRWFFVMSIYYGLLSVARIFVYLQISPDKPLRKRIKTMLVCGCFLLVINLVISAMMFILIFGHRPVNHHEITVIALATYTFSTLTFAIIGSVKQIKKQDHVFSCVQLISLVSASVSIVTLTNTMLATFGEGDTTLRQIILPVLCGAVSVFITASAILMIRKATLDLRKLNNEKE